jgi:hypothetical protein
VVGVLLNNVPYKKDIRIGNKGSEKGLSGLKTDFI